MLQCPFCGAPVEGKLDRCPACHMPLGDGLAVSSQPRWCESCGTPVPEGLDACPQCGMPTGDGASIPSDAGIWRWERTRRDAQPRPVTLVSAIPDTTIDGTEVLLTEEHESRGRLIALALAAAVALVGGATLYITRPWDPNAYAIHAFEDADTSMEGYPGLRTHLSQDASARDEEQALEQQADASLDAFRTAMADHSLEADAIEADLESYIAGEAYDASDVERRAHRLRETFAGELEGVEGIRVSAGPVEDKRQSLLVLAGYLTGELETLDRAAALVSQGNDRMLAVANAKDALAGGIDGYSFDEWRDLYLNAAAAAKP